MQTLYPLEIRYIGNSPVLIQKIKDYLKHLGYAMTHYHDAPADGACDYFFIIDPIEQETKRLRLQELWKRELQKKTPSVKMLVFDWWACRCNGFLSPMDVPHTINLLLAEAQPIGDIKHCKHCHKRMEKEISHLFKPHGNQSPLIDAQCNIKSLIYNIEGKKWNIANQRIEEIKTELNRYENVLNRSTFITDQTPFRNDFNAVKARLAHWNTQLVMHQEIGVFEEMSKEMDISIDEINGIAAEIGFIDKIARQNGHSKNFNNR